MPHGLQHSGFDDIYDGMFAEDLLEQRRQDALDEMYRAQFHDHFPEEMEMPSFEEFNFDTDFNDHDMYGAEFEENRQLDGIFAEVDRIEARFARRDRRRSRNLPFQTRNGFRGLDATSWKSYRKHRWSRTRSVCVLPSDLAAA